MQTTQDPPYPLAARMPGSQANPGSNFADSWVPSPPVQPNAGQVFVRSPSPAQQQQYAQQQQQLYSQQQQQQYPQQQQQEYQLQQPQQQHTVQPLSSQNPSSSLGSTTAMPSQPNAPYTTQRPASSSNLTPTPMSAGSQRTTPRKMTAGSSPLASSPLASVPARQTRVKPKAEMPTTLPPESVCECFICHSVSPYSQQSPPEIPVNQRQELSRLAPTCPSIHLFCLASRIPMSLPLDANQKSPLTRSILDYFYSTWISDDSDMRGPRVQCLNFIPIHPITASCFDRYLEGQSWNKRICRPLWHAADLRCKLGMEGMYRNCMQDKCASCFIFNDGFEDTISKNKFVHLSPNSSRAHEHLASIRAPASGSNADALPDTGHKVQCMILSFAALGRSYDVPPSNEKMKRPPKGLDVVRRQYEIRGRSSSGSSDSPDNTTGEEYGVFAADAVVPLVMVLYKVV
ncbi:hypothetical protein EDD21DRAFT_197446 [Dissophora ornata]|nr:hypothetical protein BGZ58_005582 [Dissophora ornata]KAI8598105.1 hypothetical protein EDD21DRAFT_197446 [Dissophora ornata]